MFYEKPFVYTGYTDLPRRDGVQTEHGGEVI